MNRRYLFLVCNGICHNYKAIRRINHCQYVDNQKRCQRCEIYIKWDGKYCPCCNYQLRTRPRNSKAKQNFLRKLYIEVNH